MKFCSRLVLLWACLLPFVSLFSLTPENNRDSLGLFDRTAQFGEQLIDLLTYEGEKGVFVIYPAGGYSSRTGLEFGLMPVFSWHASENTDGFVSSLLGTIQFSTNGMLELRSELDWYQGAEWQIQAGLGYQRVNDRFWGIYDADGNGDGVSYISRRTAGSMRFMRQLGGKFYAGMLFRGDGFSFSGLLDDDDYDMAKGYSIGGGPVLLFDSRNHVFYPQQGYFVTAQMTRFGVLSAGDFQFNTYMVDARKYFSLGVNVLAMQALWMFAEGHEVPAFMMPTLGGKSGLRGIGHSQRVMHNGISVLRGELRMPLWWRFGCVAFGELGHAGVNPSPDLNHLIGSYGGGLRFRILPREPLHIRFDAAVSTIGTTGFFISLKEAF
ncbi:BamA/TamA family outer membrane protein [Alkaliflexus imshenetskii]|uniref:BamA/TamA family outer membrane protein n=1 Tax=Alkaliflexus imshenetskii TaxID=286730 RepID=UPI00047B57F9|nr:BamA/TamA family outer membrane protein [Alkaliflexus imshenetskii]